MIMSLFHLNQFFAIATSTLGIITLGNLVSINAANAFGVTFQNTNFDDPNDGSGTLANWSTHGDVSTAGDINYTSPGGTVSPISGANQAIITTGYVDGTYDGTERDDDGSFEFNQSGFNPLDADTNSNSGDLQSQLGFGVNAFSIPRTGSILPDPRTTKEGSAMYQDFTITLDGSEDNFTINFNWAYVTNDGDDPDGLGGESDFAFWSLGQVNGTDYTTVFSSTDSPTNEIAVLDSSGGSIVPPTGNDVYGQGVNYSSVSYSVDTTGLSSTFTTFL